MSKEKQLESALHSLRMSAKNVLEIVDALEKEYLSEKTETPKATAKTKPLFDLPAKEEEKKEEPTKTISLAEIKTVLMEKSKAGFDVEVHALIKSYDAPKLSAIDSSFYPELLEKARSIGNA